MSPTCQSDLRNQRIEAWAMGIVPRGEAQIVITDVDGLSWPAELAGPRAQGVCKRRLS